MRIKNYISYSVPLLFVVATTPVVIIVTQLSQRVIKPVKEVNVEEKQHLISPYDKIFQDVGEEYGIDWLLLSAIARAESEFRLDAVSKAGAIGLMQIMPSTAKSMGYEREQLFDAEVSAEIAAMLLHENNKMLRLPKSFDKAERLNFILACYNAGYSRIADARRLARHHSEDANQWSVVQKYLALLAEPQYYEQDIVRSGEFGGSEETISYVGKVVRLYGLYKELAAEIKGI
ncbi:MAG: transglycosylase SLT domain-containing protein [Alistipes sp.]|nr:transglycosylase SLT domain-containing protein [Alistipes sp.]